MDEKNAVIADVDEKVFRPPADLAHLGADTERPQPSGVNRQPKTTLPHPHCHDATADQVCVQTSADSLDLGELGHRAIVHEVIGRRHGGIVMPKLERMLVPVDFSRCSGAALIYAAFLAEPFRAPLDVLHVIRPPPAAPGAQVMVDVSGKNRQSFREFARAQAEKDMKAFINAAELPTNLSVNIRFELGEPWRVILQIADELHSDMIVMGTRGRTGLKHLIMGSVAEKVVRRGPCAVLTIQDEEADPIDGDEQKSQ